MIRHSLATRLWHWLNLPCVVILFMSGLTISNAHRYLYWGEGGFVPAEAWLAVPRWPDWATIPGYYSLPLARDWHVLMAWPFALLLAFAWAAQLGSGHFRRELATSRSEWRWSAIRADIAAHLRRDFAHGGGRYNFLQKLSYGLILGLVLPLLVATGMAISPGLGPGVSWLVEILGGRQSARSLHFLAAFALCAFFVVHVVMVLLSGPVRQMRAMIVGRAA